MSGNKHCQIKTDAEIMIDRMEGIAICQQFRGFNHQWHDKHLKKRVGRALKYKLTRDKFNKLLLKFNLLCHRCQHYKGEYPKL